MATKRELIDGIIDKVSDSDHFEDVAWVLDAPIVNHTMGRVDDIIHKNVDFHAKAGLSPKVVRKEVGNCCAWCKEVVGTYEYPGVPNDVYKRHDRCKCVIEYYPGDGRKQDVHTKQWQNNVDVWERADIIISGGRTGKRDPYSKRAEEHAVKYYGLIRSRNDDVPKISANTGIAKSEIQKIKNYLFVDTHDLGDGLIRRFYEDYAIAESWRRLIDGTPAEHDWILLKHEMLEIKLINQGMSQDAAHIEASKKYNYNEAVKKYYGKD